MGKKSKEPREDKEEAVKSLFGTDKSFRRKPQSDAADGDAGGSTQPTKKLRLGIDSSAAEKETITEAKVSDVEHSDARKRKGDKDIIAETPSSSSSDEEFIPRKRTKCLEEAEVDGLFESDLQMGKKCKDPKENKEETVKSHFGTDKPFRRKLHRDAADGDAGGSTQPTKKLRLWIDSSAAEEETVKSKDPKENKEETVKSHFGTDKPFRRKLHRDAADGDAGGSTQPTKKLRLWIDSSAAEEETVKSKDPKENKEETVKSHFGTDKPFRRKLHQDAADGNAGGSTQPTKKLRLWIDSSAAEEETITEAKVSDAEHADARKRKGDMEIISETPSSPPSDDEFIPKKQKKLVEEAEVDGLFESGKKSKDPRENKEEAVKSHFGTDKPLCRKPQADAADGDVGGSTQPTEKLRSGIDSSAAEKETETKVSDVGHSDARKRRDRETTAEAPIPPSSEGESIPRKRKKLVEAATMDGLKKINKRKRDKLELEYEKRKFGLVGEDEPAATVVAVGKKRKADATIADMMDVKEYFDDDESKLLRTAFVGNLPLKTKMKALKLEFARFGEIESVRIISLPLVDIKTPRKAAVMKGQINEEVNSMYAYIVFKEEQSAHAALSNNMTQIGGNHIRVGMTCPPLKKMKGDAQLYDIKRTKKKERRCSAL